LRHSSKFASSSPQKKKQKNKFKNLISLPNIAKNPEATAAKLVKLNVQRARRYTKLPKSPFTSNGKSRQEIIYTNTK
jgi:hypothetical protein